MSYWPSVEVANDKKELGKGIRTAVRPEKGKAVDSGVIAGPKDSNSSHVDGHDRSKLSSNTS